MPEALSLTSALLVSAVLLISAWGKLRDPDRAAAAFDSLQVPPSLARPWMRKAHPWGEIALGLLLVATVPPVSVVAAVAALALLVGYLVLVVSAVRRPVDVDCACFGALGASRVTGRTVWRNALLVALGVLSVAGASAAEETIIARALADPWWIVALALAAVTVALVLGDRGDDRTPGVEAPVLAVESEDGDYLRSRTPAVPISFADGSTSTLRALSLQRAQLLVFVSEGCASCVDVIAAIPTWQRELEQIDVRVVVAAAPDVTALASSQEPQSIHDVNGWLRDSLGTASTPSAVLLGADGLLAGGPVIGSEAVPEFIGEVRAQLGV